MQDPAALGQAMSQMTPMYEVMMQTMVEGTLKAMEQPATIERMAVVMRRYYEALLRQGFSRDEALQIVAGMGLPGMGKGR